MTKINLAITTGLLLLIFGFWLYGLEWLHMRPDEHLVYMHTDTSLAGTVAYQATRDVQAPLWHAFFWNWRGLAGDSEFAGRYQGVLWSLITLSLMFLIARTWFGEARFGWVSMAAVGVNSHFFTYAFEIRPYPLVLLAAALSVWSLWRWLHRPSRRRLAVYTASLALMAYTHYFLAFLVAAQWLYVLLMRSSGRVWRGLGVAAAGAALLWGPWGPFFVGQVRALRRIDGTFGIGSTTTATSWPVVADLNTLATNGLPLMVWGVLALGLWTARRREYLLLALWAVGVPAIALAVNLVASVYDPRYIVYMSLGVGAAAGVALAGIRPAALGLVAGGVFVAAAAWALPTHLPDRIPHRTIYREVSAQARVRDAVFYDGGGEDSTYVTWLLNQYLAPHLRDRRLLTLEETTDERRLWHMTGDLRNPDVLARFRELERTRPLTTVIGACETWCYVVQLLEGAPLTDPIPFFIAPVTLPTNEDLLPFYGSEVLMDGDELRVKLWWMPDAPLSQDYSMSVRLVDADGAVVLQADGPPKDQGGTVVNTSMMEPERMLLDERTLTIPPDLAPGSYRVLMVVYHPMEGYTLRTPAVDQVLLDTITRP